jgi:hypothetical protein
MRSLAGVCVVVAGVLLCRPAAAEDVETLKKELAQVRQQFEAMKDGYEKAINQLGERIKALESMTPPGAPPAAPVQTAPGAPSAAPTAAAPGAPPAAPAPPAATAAAAQAPVEPPGLLELARPREPFSLYQRRGAGQLLFDMGVAGDFIGDLTQNNVQQAQGGTFPGLENYFFPREIELSLFGQIDPYARAEVRFEASQDQRGQDINVSLAEANLTLMTLPFGTQAKLGQMRVRFGLTNQIHEHDLPFIDRPDVLVQFFGQDGLVEKGGEATWVPPLPFFLELLGGVFNGDNENAFGLGSIKNPLVTGRVRTFFDLEELGAVQLGMSVANGLQPDRLNTLILGWDGKYKYVPSGWQHPLLTVAGELLYQMRQIDVVGAAPDSPPQRQTLNRVGWYLFGEAQPFRFGLLSRFVPGFRYDWTEYPTSPGHHWAVEPYLSFLPSEFLRFRVGYKHTQGNTPGCCTNTDVGSARIKDEFFFQSTFILGAHPAHPF